MLFRILGPVEIGRLQVVAAPTRTALLTALLLRAGQPVNVDELSEFLWDDPPASATANIRSHTTGVRRVLDSAVPGLSDRLRTHRGSRSGYTLCVDAEELDLHVFTLRARRGRNLLLRGEVDEAVVVLEEALALWRAPFGRGLPPTRWFDAHAAGINSARFDAYQDLFSALVLADRTTELLVYRIESVVAEAPYRQGLWELLAAAHSIHGDAAGALSAITRCRRLFADDLGLCLPPRVEAMQRAALAWNAEEARRLVAARALSTEVEAPTSATARSGAG
ncbi:AfsR/SARP family transcriptional regulator [Streptomyces alkaliterrae]|uniref:Transcriptional regulator n=1 Tax=Streptomyces alkaliterrae TaxID=2213162 RepID=A0A5P0YQU8_9ACTN|nr:BTAD domain-containing putative transcriptional regulator [Streptomyces alkaliterrae]MBB1260788.1 winged helix-turn-helix domain-containing protein [Streptomyces alkaliterrae]MQS02635.1 transcriptional regulator [Streptomyces alkaliterrae]